MDLVVLVAVGFVIVFVAAWIFSPNLRTWIERPKYRFLAAVKDYDRLQVRGRNPQ
jgi:hypothetical protein